MHAADQGCLRAWMALGNLMKSLAKKEGALKMNTKKVEALLYDMSVVRSSGGGGGADGGGSADGGGGAEGGE